MKKSTSKFLIVAVAIGAVAIFGNKLASKV